LEFAVAVAACSSSLTVGVVVQFKMAIVQLQAKVVKVIV